MKKKIVACLLAIGIAVSVTGCGDFDANQQVNNKALDSRFVIIEASSWWYTFYDKETKVIYFMKYGSYSSGISPLLDADGNVQFYTGDKM